MSTNNDTEQVRWLLDHLDRRFARLEARMDGLLQELSATSERMEQRLAESEAQTEARLSGVEDSQLKLTSQAGLIKNLLAFVGTAVLSLLGWAASTFLFPSGK